MLKLDRKKIYYFYIFLLSVSLIFLLGLIDSIKSAYVGISRDKSTRIEIRNTSGMYPVPKLEYKHIMQLRKNSSMLIAFLSSGTAAVSTDNKRLVQNTRIIATDSMLELFMPIRMISGVFLSEDSCIYGKNYAVISSSLSYKLFSSCESIGNSIILPGGHKYVVSGVFKRDESLLAKLGWSGEEEVFIPFSSLSVSVPIQNVYISSGIESKDTGKSSNWDPFFLQKVESMIAGQLGINHTNLEITDFGYIPLLLEQLKCLVIFLFGIYIIFLTAKVSIKFIKNKVKACIIQTDCLYPADILKKEWKYVTIVLVILVFSVIWCIFLYRAVRYKINIPALLLPPDNLFDISFYKENINHVRHSLYSDGGFPASLHIVSVGAILISLLAAALFPIILILLNHFIYTVKKAIGTLYSMLYCSILSISVGLILALFLKPILNLSFSYSTKDIVLVLSYILLRYGAVD